MTAGIAAQGSRTAYYYCVEAADGTIDDTAPAFVPIRLTQSGLQEQSNELTSDELRPDRHRAASRRGATSVSGDIVGELSYGTFDDLMEAALCGTWTTNVLDTGKTRRSFAILKRNKDIGVDTIYRGCEVNELKFACPLQEKITVTFSVIGKAEEAYTVPIGATFEDATTTDYMTTFEGSLSIGSATFNAATELNLTLGNNIEAKYSLFNRPAYAMKIGMIDCTGDLSAYIEDDTMKDYYRNETEVDFSIVLTDAKTGGNKYTIALPAVKFSSAQDTDNADDFSVQQLNFRSLYDSTADTEISITRTDAA